jgi:hypothetical protein
MTAEVKANIKGAFEANPGLDTLFADENGHCFSRPIEGLTEVKRADFVGKGKPANDAEADEPEAPETETGKTGKGKKK